jgi:hypothetical protein
MTLHTRTLMIAIAALAFAAGCGTKPPPKTDGGTGGGSGSTDCIEDLDCPNAQLFFCNTASAKCEASCRTKADCTAAVRGEFALDYCAKGLGCECDEGKCVGSLCSSDAECSTGQACRSGQCVEPPAASTVASCSVTPDYVVVKQGEKARFWVSAWDAAKNPVVVKTGITWTAATAAVVAPAAATGYWADFTAGPANTAAEAAVKASVGGKDCFGKVLVLSNAAPAANTVNVVVTDELSGRPIAGADVLATRVADGTAIGAAVVTDAKGFANVNVGALATVTVSVFHADHNYLTVVNYDMTGSRFLSFVLRRNQVDKYGGYKGTFSNVPATPNVHAGLAGASLAGSITDLSINQLLGPSIKTRVKIGTAIDQMNVPLPAGVFLGFTAEHIKDTVSAQGLAGVCANADGTPNEAAINAGTCGTRSAWALAGDVPLGDLPIDAVTGGLDNVDFGKVLSRIIPIFKKFNSSIVRDVSFTLKTTARDTDGGYRFSEDDGGLPDFTVANHDFTQVPLAFNFAAKVPDLPKYRGSYVDAVVLLGGAIVPGRGVVPLGIGAAVNTTPLNAKTDQQVELPSEGLVSLRMAPTHHGIEGTDYAVVALGASVKSATDVTAGLATSAIFSRLPQNALRFDPKGASPVDLGASFPPFPETAKYNFSDVDQPALKARTFKFADQASSGATGSAITRVVFTDSAEHRWVVYMEPSQGATGFVLPKPSGTNPDRTFYTGMTTGSRSLLLVQQLRLNDNPSGTGSALTFNKLVEFNSTNADRLVDFTTGFSLIDYTRPTVGFLKPDQGAEINKGEANAITVLVKGFKIGTASTDDGYLHVSFTPATAGCTDVDVKTGDSTGKGEIGVTVPATCVLADATITATLYGPAAAAVSPPVSAVLKAKIK